MPRQDDTDTVDRNNDAAASGVVSGGENVFPKDPVLLNLIAEWTGGDFNDILNLAHAVPAFTPSLQHWKCSKCEEEIFLPQQQQPKEEDVNKDEEEQPMVLLSIPWGHKPFFCSGKCTATKFCGGNHHYCSATACSGCGKLECWSCKQGWNDWRNPCAGRADKSGCTYCKTCQGTDEENNGKRCDLCRFRLCKQHGFSCDACSFITCGIHDYDCEQCGFCDKTLCPQCNPRGMTYCTQCEKYSCEGDTCPGFCDNEKIYGYDTNVCDNCHQINLDEHATTCFVMPLVPSKRRKVSLDTNTRKSDTESEDEESEESDDEDDDVDMDVEDINDEDKDEDDGWKTKLPDALPTTLKDVLSLMDELLTKKGKSPVESFSQVLFFSSKNGKRLRVKLRKMKADGEPKLQWQEKGKEWCPKTRNDLIDFVEVLHQIAIERSYPPVIVKKKKAEPTTKKQAKKKKKKDPNAPKKGMTAYLLFCGAIRPIVKEENPEATFGEISKIIGRKYKELDDNERKPYDEAAAKEKVRFKLESESYHADLGMKSEEDD